jgi:hypothetical protein
MNSPGSSREQAAGRLTAATRAIPPTARKGEVALFMRAFPCGLSPFSFLPPSGCCCCCCLLAAR